MKTLLCAGFFAVMMLPSSTLASASPADTMYVATPIIIKAKRNDPNADLFDRAGFVAAVDLSERRDRVEDLSAVLTQMVGVTVKQYGGLGDFATVSIRGSSASHVSVYLDGVPMNGAYTGVVNLSDFPLGGVQRVEVYRGFAPPHLGSGAIGGAINLVTTDPARWQNGRALSDLEVLASYGSFDTSRLQISTWLQSWRARLFLYGGATNSLGNFSFLDDNGTPVNPDDDAIVDRLNNANESRNALGRLEVDLPGLEVASITYDAFYRDQGVAGLGSHQSTTARSQRERRLSHLRLETLPFMRKQLQASATGFYSDTWERFTDPDATVALGRQDTDNTILAWGGLGSVKWFVPLVPLTLQGTFERRSEEYRPADNIPVREEGPTRSRRARTIVVAADVFLLSQTLVVSVAQRWQRHVNEFYNEAPYPWLPPSPQGRMARQYQTPSMGLRWDPLSFLTVKGNVGRYYRLPTFLELFGNLGTVTGSAVLEPEEGLNRDIGVVLHLNRAGLFRNIFAEVVYVDNEADNLILFFPNSQNTVKPANIGSAKIKGWEFSLAAFLGQSLQLSGNYTNLDTKDTSEIPYYNGNDLPTRPRQDMNAVVSWVEDRWKLTYELHFIGANYLDRANMRRVDARDLHNVIFKLKTPVDGLSFALEVRNVTDNRKSDVSGYPLPGRTAYSTLSYKM